MAKDIYVGPGAIVEYNPSGDDLTWVQVGCATEMTPSPEEVGDIEATCLESTSAVMRPGIEAPGEATFIQIYDPGDTADAGLVTDFKSRTVCNWRYVYPGDGGKTATCTFEAYIKALGYPTVSGTDSLQREVTLMRTSDNSWVVATP